MEEYALVKDFSYVKKGDEIFPAKFAERDGIVFFDKASLYDTPYHWKFEIYDSLDDLLNIDLFKPVTISNENPVTKEVILECRIGLINKIRIIKKYVHSKSNSFLGMDYISLYFQNKNNTNYMCFDIDKRSFKLKKGDSIIFIFDDNSTLSYTLCQNPQIIDNCLDLVRFPLYQEDLDIFLTKNLYMCQISFANRYEDIRSIFEFESAKAMEGFSQTIFRNYVKCFAYALKQNGIAIESKPNETINDKEPIPKAETCFVYLMMDVSNGFYKIGISNKPHYREHTLQSEKPTIELVCSKEYPHRKIAEAIEKALHNAFSSKRIRGEWFNLDDNDLSMLLKTLA